MKRLSDQHLAALAIYLGLPAHALLNRQGPDAADANDKAARNRGGGYYFDNKGNRYTGPIRTSRRIYPT